MSRHHPAVLFAAACLAGFISLLAYFHIADIYDQRFFEPDVVLVYNLARSIFAIYLFTAACAPGYALLSAIGGRDAFHRLRPAERVAVSFFCGAALWHAVLLPLGFLSLYRYPVAVALAVPAVAAAGFVLPREFAAARHGAEAALAARARPGRAVMAALAAIVVTAALLLLAMKGLFPAGGHDYYNHYHGYYELVLLNHGIWPNDAWYHFYYSKGLGLFFLASLLSDPLAPSLVTCGFAAATAMALYQLIDRMSSKASLWPWAAVVAYLVLYAYTPGVDLFRAHGGWGDFEKPHEVSAGFVFGFVWAAAGLLRADARSRRIWFAAAASMIFAVAFIELASVFVLGLFVVLVVSVALARCRYRDARAFSALGVVAGGALATVLGLNYAITGLPSDAFVLQTWRWADLRKLHDWGALPYVVILTRAMTRMHREAMPLLSRQFWDFLGDLLRLDLLSPLMILPPVFAAAVAGAAGLRWRRGGAPEPTPLALVAALIAVVAICAAAAGTVQPISFYRYTSFCLPAMLALAGCGWLLVAESLPAGWASGTIRHALPAGACAAALVAFWTAHTPQLAAAIASAARFAAGTVSIRQAYSDQQAWAGRMEWGGIFPGMVGAWQAAGPYARIWSPHVHSFCMLPHCRSETYFSFILSPHQLDLLAASPEEVRDTLRREGLSYFFYTTDLGVEGLLPHMAPFKPDAIQRYLGIKWTDGKSYLLTWLGPGVTPLSDDWTAEYAEAIDAAPVKLFLDIREQMRQGARRGGELKLPWIGSE